ncbi:MAG: hypothetical protein ABI595_09705 [Actinomycetota bacterium]
MRPSRVPLVVGVLLVAAFFGTGALLWDGATRPAICDEANITSERFGYCITAPPGWRLAEPVGEELPADQLFRPEGDTTLMIQAIETGRDLSAFAEDVRRLQTDNGLDTEEMRALTVAGVDALQWDATLGSSGVVKARTVVFLRDGIAWRLQFADSTKVFDEHVRDLARMLRSWQFR